MPLSTATWPIGDPGDPSPKQFQQDRANAPFALLRAPPSKGSKSTKTKPATIRRQLVKSQSTPQLRNPLMSEYDIDKKRSKLGYQRSTLACAHCRRRKIRCIPAEDETEQRCSNCIRLQKECVYYPVDQQIALDARSQSSSKTSSPPLSSTRIPGQHAQQRASSSNLPLEAQPAPRSMSIAPSINPAVPGSYSAPIPQTGQFGPEHYMPMRPAFNPQQGQVWTPSNNIQYQGSGVAVGNPVAVQSGYSPYQNPSLQPDTAPYPASAYSNQMQPMYGGAGPYNPSQQWQQNQQPHQQPGVYSHYQQQQQQHVMYYPPVPQGQQLPGSHPHRPDAQFVPPPPSQAPPHAQHPPHMMQPSQGQHVPAGQYYVPTQHAPNDWPSGPPQFSPSNPEARPRYPGGHPPRPG